MVEQKGEVKVAEERAEEMRREMEHLEETTVKMRDEWQEEKVRYAESTDNKSKTINRS